jgi:hypothetical protein
MVHRGLPLCIRVRKKMMVLTTSFVTLLKLSVSLVDSLRGLGFTAQAGAGGAARIPSTPCAPGHLLIYGVHPKLKRLRSPRGGRRLARLSRQPASRRAPTIFHCLGDSGVAAITPLDRPWACYPKQTVSNSFLSVPSVFFFWRPRVAQLPTRRCFRFERFPFTAQCLESPLVYIPLLLHFRPGIICLFAHSAPIVKASSPHLCHSLCT